MRIASFPDRKINFLAYARWFVRRPSATTAFLFTDRPGFTLLAAQVGRSYVVLIRHGRKTAGAVLLTQSACPRLSEAFGFVVEPHAYVAKPYRGLRLVEGVYRWALAHGLVFCSNSRQTLASNGLWKKLSADHHCALIDKARACVWSRDAKIGRPQARLLLSARPIDAAGQTPASAGEDARP